MQLDPYEVEMNVFIGLLALQTPSTETRLVAMQKAEEEPLYSRSSPQFSVSRTPSLTSRNPAKCTLTHYRIQLSFVLYFFSDHYSFVSVFGCLVTCCLLIKRIVSVSVKAYFQSIKAFGCLFLFLIS